jgi:hypothetical protein
MITCPDYSLASNDQATIPPDRRQCVYTLSGLQTKVLEQTPDKPFDRTAKHHQRH